MEQSEGLHFGEGYATPDADRASYTSVVRRFDRKVSLESFVLKQKPDWLDWNPISNIGPSNLEDAPVFLNLGEGNYWIFGRYGNEKARNEFASAEVELDGFDTPLKTTPFENQYDAPGGLEKSLGGYHAWKSVDMVRWVHYGPVTENFSRWVTTAEYFDGKAYIYYDFPNDQDPHLYIDDDLTDGVPGKDMGLAFKDPSDGSDCAIIRGLDGRFHLIYEDWIPINAGKHSWDSPLAGHAVSPQGYGEFEILPPAVDERTTPTGTFAEYPHPHWHQTLPEKYPAKMINPGWKWAPADRKFAAARYEMHEPEQNAYGDWAAIGIGGQYYLFGDFHPAGKSGHEMSVAWFTSSSLYQPFEFCDHIGEGHPDPDVIFAEGQFYLITQMDTDYVSPGPWVPGVEVRVGVDTDGDGQLDSWSDWQEVEERYVAIEGYAKQVERFPANMDTTGISPGYGFCSEVRVSGTVGEQVRPVLDSLILSFE